jgi:hypothetical protein
MKNINPKLVVFKKHTKEYQKILKEKYPEFKPNLTPKQLFELGSFHDQGGYFRPINSMFFKNKLLKNQHKEHMKSGNCLQNVDEKYLITPNNILDKNKNKYKVKAGTSLEDWEEKGWIIKQDPYGWVQWYCRFCDGRRSDDDDRQIKRWIKFAGEKSGRFIRRLIKMIKNNNSSYNDENISPVIRQSLQHWAYQLTEEDYNKIKNTL